jgi:NADPH2:quinone reductase
MGIAIRLAHTGTPDVLKVESIRETHPGPGEVWIEQEAIGVNYLDISQRRGAAPIPLPSGLGLEAAGRVAAVGPEVDNVKVGERVAYILGPIGSYTSGRLYPAERLIRLPDSISSEDAAAVLFKGITAHYLLHSTYAVTSGTVVLLYGGRSRWVPL